MLLSFFSLPVVLYGRLFMMSFPKVGPCCVGLWKMFSVSCVSLLFSCRCRRSFRVDPLLPPTPSSSSLVPKFRDRTAELWNGRKGFAGQLHLRSCGRHWFFFKVALLGGCRCRVPPKNNKQQQKKTKAKPFLPSCCCKCCRRPTSCWCSWRRPACRCGCTRGCCRPCCARRCASSTRRRWAASSPASPRTSTSSTTACRRSWPTGSIASSKYLGSRCLLRSPFSTHQLFGRRDRPRPLAPPPPLGPAPSASAQSSGPLSDWLSFLFLLFGRCSRPSSSSATPRPTSSSSSCPSASFITGSRCVRRVLDPRIGADLFVFFFVGRSTSTWPRRAS